MIKIFFIKAQNPPEYPRDARSPKIIVSDIEQLTHEQWLEIRSHYITGSKVGIIAGVGYGDNSPEREFYIDTGRYVKEPEYLKEGSFRLDFGTYGEDAIFAVICKHPPIEGMQIGRDRRMLQCEIEKCIAGNMDGVCYIPDENGNMIPCVLEIKTVANHRKNEYLDGNLPAINMYQVRTYMAITGYRYAVVIASWGWTEDDCVCIIVERDMVIENQIIEMIRKYNDAVNGGDTAIVTEAQARYDALHNAPNTAVTRYVDLHPDMDPTPVDISKVASEVQGIYEEQEEARKLESEARKHKKLAEEYTARVLSTMNGHSVGTSGPYTVSVGKTRESSSYDSKKLDKLPKEFVESSKALEGDDKADLREEIKGELEQSLLNRKVKKGGNPTIKMEITAPDDE